MNFNLQKFSADVKEFRKVHKLSQLDFAGKLELENHSLVSMYELGKRAPSKVVFAKFCELTGRSADEYWESTEDKPSVYLMGNIAKADKDSLDAILEKIEIREYLFALYDRVKK